MRELLIAYVKSALVCNLETKVWLFFQIVACKKALVCNSEYPAESSGPEGFSGANSQRRP